MINLLYLGLTGSCFLYYLLPEEETVFLPFLGLFTLQFTLLALLSWLLAKSKPKPTPRHLFTLLAASILCRIIVMGSEPVLENDYFRYMWEGRVVAHGENPYLYSPDDPALDHLDVAYREEVAWSEYRTIYPPVSQGLFALTHLIAPDSLLGVKILFTLFDLGIGILLIYWLAAAGLNPLWSGLYLLNPLVLKEISNSAHLDSMPVFFMALAVFWAWKKQKVGFFAWLFLALATGMKWFPIFLVPLFAKLDPRWKRHLAFFFGFLALIYVPFLGAGLEIFDGSKGFATHWIWNAGIFKALAVLNRWSGLDTNGYYIPKAVIGLVFTYGVFHWWNKLKETDQLPYAVFWLLGLLLLLSPVVNGWYILWILPFAILFMSRAWLAFSFLVVAGYAWHYNEDYADWAKGVEYVVFYILLFKPLSLTGANTIFSQSPKNLSPSHKGPFNGPSNF